MKQLAAIVLKAEELIASSLLCIISILVFISAVARTCGYPINWAQDVALLAFAWLTFIGSDVLARSGKLINIDMLIYKLPKGAQKIIGIVFDFMMMAFLAALLIFGYSLVTQSWLRVFNTLKLSYAWCTGGRTNVRGDRFLPRIPLPRDARRFRDSHLRRDILHPYA